MTNTATIPKTLPTITGQWRPGFTPAFGSGGGAGAVGTGVFPCRLWPGTKVLVEVTMEAVLEGPDNTSLLINTQSNGGPT